MTFKKGDKFILELGEERKMFDEFQIAGTDLYVKKYLLEKLTPYKPETHSCDCISRAAAIKAIDVKNVNKGIISALQSIIEELPSAQADLSGYSDRLWKSAYERGKAEALAEREKGKWIKHIDDLFPSESTIECPICHHEQPLTIDDNYCPNCGLRMEVEG